MKYNKNINQTYIIESVDSTPVISGCTSVSTNHLLSCTTDIEIDLSGNEIVINKSLIPVNDNNNDLGLINKRFREINTHSGTSSVWVVESTLKTPKIELGVDSQNNNRIITADNSVLNNDILLGGNY
jgi:hypothetical protein